MKRAWWKWALAAGILAGGAFGVAYAAKLAYEARTRALAPTPEVDVPASYDEVRQSDGHVAHLALQGEDEVACRDCHDVSGRGFGPEGLRPCARCHEEHPAMLHAGVTDATGGTDGEEEPPGCTDCHAFRTADEWKADDCARCHEDAGEHALAPHGAVDGCTDCHEPHAERAIECTSCHEEVTLIGHGPAIGQPADCLSCHRGHGEQTPGACGSCHETGLDARAVLHVPGTTLVASAQAGSTHPARQPARDAGGAGEHPTLPPEHAALTVAPGAPPIVHAATALSGGHRECTSCHGPHDFEAGGGSCRGCHTTQHVLGGPDAHRACTSCHAPHAVARTRACTSCHASLGNDHTAGNDCASCHTVHPARGAGQPTCTSCHGEVVQAAGGVAHAQTLECASCHQAHDFVEPRGGRCASCHGEQSRAAASHAACTACHTTAAHRPSAPPARCGSCHAEVASSARAGHAACATCHDEHSGTVAAGHSECRSCHAEVGGAHGGARPGCESCHRIHGPGGVARPPACASCHGRDELAGLHRVADHGDCGDCHEAHGTASRATRQSCASGSCHQDDALATHQPDARRCNGCHVFTTGQ